MIILADFIGLNYFKITLNSKHRKKKQKTRDTETQKIKAQKEKNPTFKIIVRKY